MNRLFYHNILYAAVTILWGLLILGACAGDEHQKMLAHLEELERQNLADSVMTNDSLAERLAEYFDHHGTPNERMRAHYILGRTYADLGEAPAALEAYLRAASCADTTAADCDYTKLSRIHIQSARICYLLLQPRSQLDELCKAQLYALKAKDTLIAIECYAQKADAYQLLHQPESVVLIRERASQMYQSAGNKQRAAAVLGAAITSVLEINDTSRAREFMMKYEKESGLYDPSGSIQRGRETYYYAKGRFYLAINRLDTAEYFFRRLQKDGYTLNHQIASSKGLQEVYERLKKPDSIAKYANLGYVLNDSAYSLAEMEGIQRVKASYNYNRNKFIAEQKTNEAETARLILLLLVAVIVIILLFAAWLFSHYRKRKQLELLKFQNDLENLGRAQEELMELRAEEKMELEEMIRKKDEELASLQQRVAENIKKMSLATQEERLKDAPIIKRLTQLLQENPPREASVNDFKELRNLINETIPSFYSHFQMLRYPEYNVCMLIRTHFAPAQISKLTGISENYISNYRKRILLKAFSVDGSAKELDERIMTIH